MRLSRIVKKTDVISNAGAVQQIISSRFLTFRDTDMNKLLITLLFSAFAMTTYAADTDKQTDGAELGTNETPQAQDQSKSSPKKSSDRQMKKHHSNKRMKNNQQNTGASENNPLQPTEAEPAPGASH